MFALVAGYSPQRIDSEFVAGCESRAELKTCTKCNRICWTLFRRAENMAELLKMVGLYWRAGMYSGDEAGDGDQREG